MHYPFHKTGHRKAHDDYRTEHRIWITFSLYCSNHRQYYHISYEQYKIYAKYDAVIMSHLTIGDGSYIYPASVVVKNLKPNSVVAGIPATSGAAKKWD